MKEIFKGIEYDTETSTEITRWNNGLNIKEDKYYEEILYVTETGHFFLHSRGNACEDILIILGDPGVEFWIKNHAPNMDYNFIIENRLKPERLK